MPTLATTDEVLVPLGGAGHVEERTWAYEALGVLGEGVIVFDERGRLVYHNAEAEKLLGIRALPPEVSGWSSVLEIYLPDEKTLCPRDELPPLRALCGRESRNTAMFIRSAVAPAGIHVLCSSRAIRDASGAIRGAACIFRDITERRRDELQLRQGERQRTAILDNIPDMAWLKDRDGRYLAVNQPFLEAIGRRTADEVMTLTDADLFPPDLADRYRADDADVMRSGLHKRLEEPFVDAKGRQHWIETIKKGIVGDRGQVIGTTGIARDITERRLAEEALRTSNDELERRVLARTLELAEAQESLVRKERLAVLGQLAGGVAHQIRNPLAAIMNATYVLKRHLQPEQHPNVDDAIRIIRDEVRHANVIITGLLDYARVRTPDRQSASIVDLIERVCAADWIPAHVRVVRTLAHDVPPLEVDVDQLHGALFNVVRNAVDAMPNGGTLEVDLHVEDGWVVILVTDSGPGISPQVRAHLFEPLHSTKPMGIGLGLVTARTFVEAHGGRIASLPIPRGARFEIRLPSAP